MALHGTLARPRGRRTCLLIQMGDDARNLCVSSPMKRYFFDLNECGSFTVDEEGREMHDLEAAIAAALADARDWMAGEVRRGQLCLACHIEIRSAGGIVYKLPFRKALTITGIEAEERH